MQRRCRICKTDKPLNRDNFYSSTGKGCSGFKYECVACRQPAMVCSVCGKGFKGYKGASKFCSKECNFKSGFIEVEGCWEWNRSCETSGYGHFKYAHKMYRAHRFSYELFRGPVGDWQVLHKCDNVLCVNPEHLWLGTHSDNMQDKSIKGRCGRCGRKSTKAPNQNIITKREARNHHG